jgi:hypothetical protein
MASGFFHLVLLSRTSRLNPTKTRHRSDAMRQMDSENDDASFYCDPPNRGPAAIPTAEGAHDGGVPTATSSTGRDDDGGVAGIVDVDGEDFAWVDQWMEDGGDAAGFWAAREKLVL